MTAPRSLVELGLGLLAARPDILTWAGDCGVEATAVESGSAMAVGDLINAVYLLGERTLAAGMVQHWLERQSDSPHARFLDATFRRNDCVGAADWRDDYHLGFAAGLRLRDLEPDAPRWPGGSVKPRRLLIYGDQGIGDQIRRLSYLHDVVELWPDITLAVVDKLLPLASRGFPGVEVVAISEARCSARDAFSHAISLGDLEALYWDAARHPLRHGFLRPDPLLQQHWARRLDRDLPPGTLRMGICYRSSQLSGARGIHYAPIDAWLPILGLTGTSVVSLQYGANEHELADAELTSGRPIYRWSDFDPYQDVDALAAVVSGLDLVVSTTTMVADLSAALGVDTLRIQTGAGARSERTQTNPWYGARTSMVYRSAREPWSKVLASVADVIASRSMRVALS